MENASKALIIAGAILLAILIIGIGMVVYNKAGETIAGANMDPQKIAAYNSELESYGGTSISGTRARALLDVIRTHNNSHQDDPSLNIKPKSATAVGETTAPTAVVPPSDVKTVKDGIKAGKVYNVDFGYDSKTGYIVAVGIYE